MIPNITKRVRYADDGRWEGTHPRLISCTVKEVLVGRRKSCFQTLITPISRVRSVRAPKKQHNWKSPACAKERKHKSQRTVRIYLSRAEYSLETTDSLKPFPSQDLSHFDRSWHGSISVRHSQGSHNGHHRSLPVQSSLYLRKSERPEEQFASHRRSQRSMNYCTAPDSHPIGPAKTPLTTRPRSLTNLACV